MDPLLTLVSVNILLISPLYFILFNILGSIQRLSINDSIRAQDVAFIRGQLESLTDEV